MKVPNFFTGVAFSLVCVLSIGVQPAESHTPPVGTADSYFTVGCGDVNDFGKLKDVVHSNVPPSGCPQRFVVRFAGTPDFLNLGEVRVLGRKKLDDNRFSASVVFGENTFHNAIFERNEIWTSEFKWSKSLPAEQCRGEAGRVHITLSIPTSCGLEPN